MKESVEKERGFVAYSLPGTSVIRYSLIKELHTADKLDDYLNFDFIVAPFLKDQGGFQLIKFEDTKEDFQFQDFSLPLSNNSNTSIEEYTKNFNQCHELIKTGSVEKLVLSRIKKIKKAPTDLKLLFERMVEAYPDTFTFFLYHKDLGCWMGATPEVLLIKELDKMTTVALAGTKKAPRSLENVNWTDKEVEEHKYIETYIEECFAKHDWNYLISEVKEIKAAYVTHLKSVIEISNCHNIPQLIEELHPGPALSGYPPQKAINKLKSIENHDRNFYTGFLGPIHQNGNFEFYVNLRCMQVFSDSFDLYLGGGITIDSLLESEWTETELKAKTLESLISETSSQE